MTWNVWLGLVVLVAWCGWIIWYNRKHRREMEAWEDDHWAKVEKWERQKAGLEP